MDTKPLYLGHRERLKSRFIESPHSLPDYELLEILLFNAIPRKDVKKLAKSLMTRYKHFAKVINLDKVALKFLAEEMGYSIPDSVSLQFALIREAISRTLYHEVKSKEVLSRSSALTDYLIARMSNKDTEHFRILYLNTKNHLIAEEVCDLGTIDQVHVYPREIVKQAIFHSASSIILAHNHPSGIATPSKADIVITKKIVDSCNILDISVHDHVIVAGNEIFSFRANGLL